MYGQDSAVPQRETELNRELSRLTSAIEALESATESLCGRLHPLLRQGGLEDESQNAKKPGASSKLAQDIAVLEERVEKAVQVLADTLSCLEI